MQNVLPAKSWKKVLSLLSERQARISKSRGRKQVTHIDANLPTYLSEPQQSNCLCSMFWSGCRVRQITNQGKSAFLTLLFWNHCCRPSPFMRRHESHPVVEEEKKRRQKIIFAIVAGRYAYMDGLTHTWWTWREEYWEILNANEEILCPIDMEVKELHQQQRQMRQRCRGWWSEGDYGDDVVDDDCETRNIWNFELWR